MKYRLELGDTLEKIEEARDLRTERFGLEKYDKDRFDKKSDHLLLYNELNELIGTARLRPLNSAKGKLYIQKEFKSKGIKKELSNFLEFGRFCISEKEKNPFAPIYILYGVLKYAQSRNIQGIIGCTSFFPENPKKEITSIITYLIENNHLENPKELLKVKRKYKIKEPNIEVITENPEIPSLAKFYFDFGATVISHGAWDKSFKCIDFLMKGNIEEISEKAEKWFSKIKEKVQLDEKILLNISLPTYKKQFKPFA